MKQEFFQKIEIPKGVEADIKDGNLNVKGKEGEIQREFDAGNLVFEKKDNQIIIGSKKATKKEKKIINTTMAHIKNMLKGIQEKFEYQLKICFHHFPITVEIKEGEALIKNFLGETIPRRLEILKGVDVKIDGQIITVSSTNKELAGQVAANFERATKIKGRDKRVFQDGIFIISKAGRKI